MNLLLSLGISLIATLLIETAVAVLLKKRRLGLAVVLAVNLLTNPVVVLFWQLNPELPLLLPCMEVGAVLIEGCCYRLFPAHFRRPFLFSLLCNLLSFLSEGSYETIFSHSLNRPFSMVRSDCFCGCDLLPEGDGFLRRT